MAVESSGGAGVWSSFVGVFWRMWWHTAAGLDLGLFPETRRSIGGGGLTYGGGDQPDGGLEDVRMLLLHCSDDDLSGGFPVMMGFSSSGSQSGFVLRIKKILLEVAA